MRQFFNHLGNLFVPYLLRSPLHFLLSGRVMLVTFRGRSSGNVYTTPVEYRREGNTLNFFTRRGRVWWKNLQGGAEVTVRVGGHDLHGQAYAITCEPAITAAFQRMHDRITLADDFAVQTVMIQVALDETVEAYALSRS